jgi:phosphate starvation-inducible PhoH-like protein
MICDDLFGRGDGYDILKMKHMLDFTTTSFLRGVTFNDAIIIVDECQNMTDMETHTILTRVGENSKIIFCGDFRQKDYMKEQSGIYNLLKIAKIISTFSIIEFTKNDVVRSGFVKEYLFARMELDEKGHLT